MYRCLSNSFVALGDCSKHSWSIYVFRLSVRARKLHVYASSFLPTLIFTTSQSFIDDPQPSQSTRSFAQFRIRTTLKSQSIRILITPVRLFPRIVLGSKIIHHPSQACTISFPPPPPNLFPSASLRHSRPCLSYVNPSHPTHTFASSLSIPIPFRSLPTTPIPSSSSLLNISTRADEVQRRMVDGGGSGGVLRLPVSQVLAPSTLLVLTVPLSLLPHFAFSNYLHLSPPPSLPEPIPSHFITISSRPCLSLSRPSLPFLLSVRS